LLDEDIVRTSVNNILTIEFSNQIRLPRLPGKILWEIGRMIGRVAELDFNIDNGVQGRFARMVVYINLGKALISQVLINGPLKTLNDEMGSHESRPAKETNLTQKEA
ncbi:hypothetical protein Gorai_000929, partial [Gossypium raimondii]|nr:hypothetical protein [Gossypium raimondii]